MKQLQYISPLRYAFELLVRNEFKDSFINPAEIDEVMSQRNAVGRSRFALKRAHRHRVRMPPNYTIVQRINLGLLAVFGELRATANWRRIAEELWPFVSGPPSTPMAEHIRSVWGDGVRAH